MLSSCVTSYYHKPITDSGTSKNIKEYPDSGFVALTLRYEIKLIDEVKPNFELHLKLTDQSDVKHWLVYKYNKRSIDPAHTLHRIVFPLPVGDYKLEKGILDFSPIGRYKNRTPTNLNLAHKKTLKIKKGKPANIGALSIMTCFSFKIGRDEKNRPTTAYARTLFYNYNYFYLPDYMDKTFVNIMNNDYEIYYPMNNTKYSSPKSLEKIDCKINM